MTMTTEHPPTEVPAWLNIDRLVSDDLRDEIRAALPNVEALTDQITDVAALVFRLATEFDAGMSGPDAGGDEVYAVTRQTVGLTAVTDLVHQLAERLTIAADGGWGSGAKPAWLDGGEGE